MSAKVNIQERRDNLIAKRDALLFEKDENNLKIAECSAQIERSKADYRETGIHANPPTWYASVKAAKRFAGQRDQEIANELSSLSAEIKALNVMEDTSGGRLTVRDHFALGAITGILSRYGVEDAVKCAKWSYKFADAMLEARK